MLKGQNILYESNRRNSQKPSFKNTGGDGYQAHYGQNKRDFI